MRHIWWRDLKKLAMDFKITHLLVTFTKPLIHSKSLKYNNNDTVSMSPTILISHNGVRWCGYLENYIHTLFTIMMPVQTCVSIFCNSGSSRMQGGVGMPAHLRLQAGKEANRASGAYNAEETMTWGDQGLHLREQTYIITSEVKTW